MSKSVVRRSKTINEQNFRQLCDEVEADSGAILQECGELTGETAMQREIFTRLCRKLEIDVNSPEATELLEEQTGYSFAIMQTLEERMHPAFPYVEILGPLLKRISTSR